MEPIDEAVCDIKITGSQITLSSAMAYATGHFSFTTAEEDWNQHHQESLGTASQCGHVGPWCSTKCE
jgi:hypothetical protein